MSDTETQLGSGTVYMGYTLWERNIWGIYNSQRGAWGAYNSGGVDKPWFEGNTPEEVVAKIDAAFEELPDPVY